MSNILSYKNYSAKVLYSAEDNLLYGKIEGINDLVTFESEDASQVEREFQMAVDDYLDFCKEVGKEPNKAYKGAFNVRIDPDLHRALAIKAALSDTSINHEVEEAVREYVSSSKITNAVKTTVSLMLGNSVSWNTNYVSSNAVPMEYSIASSIRQPYNVNSFNKSHMKGRGIQ